MSSRYLEMSLARKLASGYRNQQVRPTNFNTSFNYC